MIDDNTAIQNHNGLYCCDLQPQGPRSRAFYYIRNSLLHTCNSYYTEPPMKVPITPNPFQSRYYAPPPIVISLDTFSVQGVSEDRRVLGRKMLFWREKIVTSNRRELRDVPPHEGHDGKGKGINATIPVTIPGSIPGTYGKSHPCPPYQSQFEEW